MVLGKKMISMSDPNLDLAARQWSITSIGILLFIKGKVSEVIMLLNP